MSSRNCAVCGGSSTQLLDGQLFCLTCGSQITSFQEYDMEEASGLKGALKLRTKKVKKDVVKGELVVDDIDLETPGRVRRKEVEKRKPAVAQSHKSKLEDLRNNVGMGYDNVAEHLHVVGRRILTFTKILTKITETLIEENNFPPQFRNTCLTLWQMYLKHCNVAFHDSEYEADLDNMYRALIERKLSKMELQKAKDFVSRKKKLDGTLALNKSVNPLQLLVSEEIDEELGLVEEDDQETVVNMKNEASEVTVIDTNISTNALSRACSMYLEPDVLVSIVYIASLATGCYFVSISDIVRWINEDRFFLSAFEYNSMGVHKSKKMTECVFTSKGLPLHEYQRIFFWFWQSIEPPIFKIDIDMKVIFTRYIYDLNLPTDFMECVHTLYRMFPMESSLSSSTVRRQGDILEGMPISEAKSQKDVVRCFGKRFAGFGVRDVFYSNEVKTMAYVLLALKLRFGLEDTEEEVGDDGFNISLWIHQLRLRLLFMDGHCATELLAAHHPFSQHEMNPFFGSGGNIGVMRRKTTEGDTYLLSNKTRDIAFGNSCPSIKRIEQKNMLPQYLPPDLCRMSNRSETGNAVLFSPLRYQANVMRDFMNRSRTPGEKDELKNLIDEHSLELFYEDFGLYALPFDGETTWERVFPKSQSFKRLPRPLWAQGCLYNYRTMRGRRLKGIDQRMFHGPCALYVSRKGCSDSYAAAEPSMSNSFKTVLKCLSKYIGETDSLLYSCYMMLELLVVDKERHLKIVEDIKEMSTIPLEYALFDENGGTTRYSGRISSYHKVDAVCDVKCYKLGYSENYKIDETADEDQYDLANCLNQLEHDSSDSDSDSDSDNISEESYSEASSSCENDSTLIQGRNEYDCRNSSMTDYEVLVSSGVKKMKFSTRVYEWDTIWHILATKYW